MVELGAEPQRGAVVGVEGEVDHGALRPEQPQCQRERGAAAAALEDDVRPTVAGTAPPAGLERDGGVAAVRVERGQAQPLGGCPAQRRRVEHHDLLGAMVSREQARQQADHAATDDRDAAPANTVAEGPHVAPDLLHGGVQ